MQTDDRTHRPRRTHIGWMTWGGTRPVFDDGSVGEPLAETPADRRDKSRRATRKLLRLRHD